jgi:hypothetical protein
MLHAHVAIVGWRVQSPTKGLSDGNGTIRSAFEDLRQKT